MRQPDDPGPVFRVPSLWKDPFILMCLVGLALSAGILVLVAFASSARGMIMQRDALSCDLYVNDYRVSWPPKILSKDECVAMAEDVKSRDETKAKITCECERGDRA